MHQDVATITERCLDWLHGLGLLAHEGVRDLVVRTRAAEWACRIAPRGHLVRLQIVSDWTHLGFVIDDLRFDAGALVDSLERLIPLMMRLMPYLDHPEGMRSGDPFEAGLRDLSARARECAPPRWCADG